MKLQSRTAMWPAVCVIVLAGCDGSRDRQADLPVEAANFSLLDEEPSGARGVMETKAEFEGRENPGDWAEVVLLARIGGIDGEIWDPDRAAFMVVDTTYVEPEQKDEAPQHDADNCPFCRANKKKLLASTALVQIVDAAGDVPAVHAKRLLQVDVGQTVVLRGEARIDGLGNLAVRATGVFVPGRGAGS
jgi:hypothetical protein